MRRKKDNKRVLRPGNGRRPSSQRAVRQRRNINIHPLKNRAHNNMGTRKKRKSNGAIILVMVIALVAFVIGAGIGVSLSFDNTPDEGPKFENVTEEMTSNLNETEKVSFEKDVDDVDYNQNVTSQFEFNYKNKSNY